jgi:general secretion pathway protein G
MRGWVARGFTLVEVLIVVIILAILAAIVLPQFSTASSDARVSSLKTNLQSMRGQIQTYKVQHSDLYPDSDFESQMTLFTSVSGGTAALKDATYFYGPYIPSVPLNPLSNSRGVRIVSGATTSFIAPTTDGGWWYNSTTGEFRADLKDSYALPDGTRYNNF